MYSFKELRKGTKIEVMDKEIRMAVLGNCSTQLFSMAVEGYAKLSGLNMKLYDAGYDQIDAQLLDMQSEVYQFRPDVILLWLATDKLYEEFMDSDISYKKEFANICMRKIQSYWNLIGKYCNARVIQMNFTEIDDKVLGQFSAKVERTFVYQIRKLNWLLEEAMCQARNVYPIDLLAVQLRLGYREFYDAAFYYNAKLCVSTKALPYIAKSVTQVIQSMLGKIKKCVILDLDNTLWGGVIGDDGISNIEVGELGRGHVFSNLQRWLKQLKECGIILAVCSKNNEEIAKEPFLKHDEMILRLDDISVFVANWEDKASNIRMIQEVLNIGMDSIVFIDDNPFERNLVRELIPEITVPELPEDAAHYLEYLQECNLFDTVSFTGGESDRTVLYQAEAERKKLQMTYESVEEYLNNLEMVGKVECFSENMYARIAQLTQRSNQFNLRTIRYTEEEIKRIAESSDYLTLSYRLKDKYGDHGLVGVVILKKETSQMVFIDTWLMSCRVLKRGMEEFIVNKLVNFVKEQGFIMIKAEYIPTNKNQMVESIYSQMGFEEVMKNHFILKISEYWKKQTYIREE